MKGGGEGWGIQNEPAVPDKYGGNCRRHYHYRYHTVVTPVVAPVVTPVVTPVVYLDSLRLRLLGELEVVLTRRRTLCGCVGVCWSM